MVLDNEPIFNNCMIKTNKNRTELQESKPLENVIKNVPTESKNYVLKLLGKNGTLDSYFLNIAQ